MLNYKKYIKESSEAKYMLLNKVNKKKLFFERFGKEFFFKYFNWRYLLTKKPSLFHIEYKVTTHCTLKCKDCCHYAPYFEHHIDNVSFEKFKKEIDELLKYTDIIYALALMGGETFLAKDLAKMVKYALSKKQIKFIEITTNATILPDDELIKVLRNRKDCIVGISDYRSNETLKSRLHIEEIRNIFDKNNILYILSDFDSGTVPNWQMPPLVLEPNKKEGNLTTTNNCRIKNCHTYANGILYLCPLQFYMLFGKDGYKVKSDEIVNIFDKENVVKKLLDFYTKSSFEFCNYCVLENTKTEIPAAIQLQEQR